MEEYLKMGNMRQCACGSGKMAGRQRGHGWAGMGSLNSLKKVYTFSYNGNEEVGYNGKGIVGQLRFIIHKPFK